MPQRRRDRYGHLDSVKNIQEISLGDDHRAKDRFLGEKYC